MIVPNCLDSLGGAIRADTLAGTFGLTPCFWCDKKIAISILELPVHKMRPNTS